MDISRKSEVLEMIQKNYLPSSNEVPVGDLSSIFDNVNNSYKFLFLLGLLRCIEQKAFRNREFSYDEIRLEMLVLAWYPSEFFKLSFGENDQLHNVLIQLGTPKFSPRNIDLLRKHFAQKYFLKRNALPDLMRYVPYRLLTSFYRNELRGISETKRNKALEKIAIDTFESNLPLYRIISGCNIEVHPRWLEYLQQNFSIVLGWAYWNWLLYLQKRNSNVPNIAEKLSPPRKKASLIEQTKYWKLVMDNATIHCIYSDEEISASNFHLDHW